MFPIILFLWIQIFENSALVVLVTYVGVFYLMCGRGNGA